VAASWVRSPAFSFDRAGTSLSGLNRIELRLGFALKFFHRFLLRRTVHGIALHQHGKIHTVGIEFGAVHAGELALAVDQHAAAAAHAGARSEEHTSELQ